MYEYPKTLLTLIAYLKKLPGVGTRTAERFAFSLLQWEEKKLHSLSELLNQMHGKILRCEQCGCYLKKESCFFCHNNQRDRTRICIVSSPKDVFTLEDTHSYTGLYYVIKSLLSPLEGKTSADLQLEHLHLYTKQFPVEEVIIALDSTLEGEATTLYLKTQLEDWGISSSRLAFGIPLGSTLDCVDFATLEKAVHGRQKI